MPKRLLLNEQISSEFFTQGTSIDAQNAGSLALVALREIHDGLEQWPFNLADNKIIQIAGPVPVQSRKILIERIFSVFAKRFLAVPGREVLLHVLFLGHVDKFLKNSFVNLVWSEARSARTT